MKLLAFGVAQCTIFAPQRGAAAELASAAVKLDKYEDGGGEQPSTHRLPSESFT